jgi:phospholipase/carboxylesterase
LTIDPHRNQPLLRFGVPLGEADRVMILLHGRGGSAEDIASLGEDLGGPDFAYLAPQATSHTWYPYSFLAPLEQNEPYLTSALGKVELIVQLAIGAGIAAEKIVVAGFSQGACLATEFVARKPRRYAGLIAFTGGLIGPPDSDLSHAGDLAGTPAYFGSGDPDPHVPWTRVHESAEVLKQMGADVAAYRYPGMPHTITREEIESARQHIRTHSLQK